MRTHTMHPDTIRSRLARDLRTIRRDYGNSNADILARIPDPLEVFVIMNTVVQWHGWNGVDLSEFECAVCGLVSLDASAVNYSTENFLLGDAAEDIPPMCRLLAEASPTLAARFQRLIDLFPGYLQARNHAERQRLFNLDGEDEEDAISQKVSAWNEEYNACPFVRDEALIRHVNGGFLALKIQWPKE